MGKKKSTNQQTARNHTKQNVGKTEISITTVLIGISLLALTIYSGWLIIHAPDISDASLHTFQTEMGFLGGLIYLIMHGVAGKGIVLFPFLFCIIGISMLFGKQPSPIQISGGVIAVCTALTMLHMNVTYVAAKDNLLLGLQGVGGGVVGAAFSMLLQKLLGHVGTYILLFCLAVVALTLLMQGVVHSNRKEFGMAIKQCLLQVKEKLVQFIFIEEEIVDEENGKDTTHAAKETMKKEKTSKKKEIKAEKLVETEECQGISAQSTSNMEKKRSTKTAVPAKEAKFHRVKNFFGGKNASEKKQSPQVQESEVSYVIIPKEKPVILNNLVEIHKALDAQEPRVGLSPRGPMERETYFIADSMEEFQQLLNRRQVNYSVTKFDQKTEQDSTSPDMEFSVEESLAQTAIDEKEKKAKKTTSEAEISNEMYKEKEKIVRTHKPEQLAEEMEPTVSGYRLPSIELLDVNKHSGNGQKQNELMQNIERLEKTLYDFGVKGKIINVSCGPAITQYEFQPAAGVKVSKIVNLSDDIALSMAVAGVRIEAPIPGKAAVGIEIPNKTTTTVGLREVLESGAFQNSKSKLTVALGKDISGQVVVADLAKMPHLLIAGSTGSGKSVCINTLINSILYKAKPDEVKFVMIDPKKVELGNYNGIPHLISPVVTDAKKAASALRWAVHEMDRRYEVFANAGVKDMPRFNALSEERIATAKTEAEKAAIERMPYIVVLIDELADLMMVAPADVEDAICRLAQLARAAGIHLVVATQRPSVDVITGIIKANMPSRIAFAVSSQTDSRTILDMGGAEKLLGRGDMLFYPTGMPKPQRVQGVYVSDQEIERITEAVKIQEQPVYNEEIGSISVQTETADDQEDAWDDLIPEATKLFIENGQASISLLQRRFRVGYTRAARIVDQMEQRGLVGPYEGSKPRQIKVTMARYNEMIENGEL